MLNDFLSNDPVLSGYGRDEVLNAFNQVSQLAPHAARQPAVMRGLLRRMLQQEGVLETHEAGQVGQMEKMLKTPIEGGGGGGAGAASMFAGA
jgi:hypothetical protein